MSKKKTARYIANTLVWGIQQQKYFNPGEVIEWDLDGEDVPDFGLLVSLEIIKPEGEIKNIEIMEVANGSDGFNSSNSIK